MPTLSSRRRPWPWDMRLGLSQLPVQHNRIGDYRGFSIGSLRPRLIGQLRSQIVADTTTNGLMLVANQNTGLLVGKKQQDLANAVPQVTDYGSAPVYKEHTFQFRPTGGMGESVQSGHTDKRYHYAIDCWVQGGLFGKGPLVHPLTYGAGGSVRRFVEALNSSRQVALFILAGDAVFERTNDSNAGQVVSRQRPGFTAMDAVRFTGAYASPADGLYVTWSDGLMEEYDGTGWKPCALPANFSANLCEVVGDELWVADSFRCHIRKCTNDPKVAGSWSGPILVGNPSATITAIRQTTNRLVMFKSSGDLFTINGDGSDNDLFPGLINTVDSDNGRTAAAWQGSLWFRTGRAFWQLDVQGGAVLTPSGPGRALANLSEVKGPVQAFAGWNSQLAFGVIYNEQNSTSYLMTYGTWEPQQGDSGTNYAFQNQWDGAVAHWTGRRATALWVSSVPSDARLYVGFADGGYDWIKLVPYPLTPNGGAEYTLGPCYIVAPLHHDQFQADTKQWLGFTPFGPFFPTDGRVSFEYRLRGPAGPPMSTAAGDFLSAGSPLTFNGQRLDMLNGVASHAIEVKINIDSSGTTTTPILEGVGFHQRLVPKFRRDFTFSVDARDYTARRDGASIRQSGRFLRDLVMQATAMPGTIALEFPDETIINLAIFEYSERMVAHSAFGGQAWVLDCQATQFGVTTLYGTIGRTRGTSIGELRGWQIVQLKRF